MFTDKMARITAAFTGQILEALRASAAAELESRRAAEAARAPKAVKAVPVKPAKPARPAKPAKPASVKAVEPAAAPKAARGAKPIAPATTAQQLRLALEARAFGKGEAPAKRGPGRPKKNAAAAPAKATKTAKATKATKAAVVTSDMIAAANRYFASRGNKGATALQLATHLGELGHDDSADVVSVLTERGAIRDAGFRRSTGVGNKTTAVFVTA